MGALTELFRDALLPPNRKLKYFSEQPLGASGDAPNERKRLLYWHVEDLVKRAYARFVNALDALSRDPLPVLKEKSVKAAFELLKSRPRTARAAGGAGQQAGRSAETHREQRRAPAPRAGVEEHPAMKRVVAREVETFCFRKGVGLKAQYYAAVLLNQFPLSHAGDGEARRAARGVYFALFQALHRRSREALESGQQEGEAPGDKKGASDKKGRWRDGAARRPAAGRPRRQRRQGGGGRGGRGGTARPGVKTGGVVHNGVARAPATPMGAGVDARVVSALLTGINRAFPYVDGDAVEPLVEKVSRLSSPSRTRQPGRRTPGARAPVSS